ncbi:MAG TPA: hypothetical protein VIC61_08140 [Gammaproteobacteria bacterium]|jgi:hypothetical protein
MICRQLFARACLLAAAFGAGAALHAEPVRVSLVFIGAEQDPAFLGVRQGLDEANLQGRFLGQEYTLRSIAPGTAAEADLARDLAIVAAADADLLRQLATRWPDHAILNVRARDESLRENCLPNLLHVIPSDGMFRDAVIQWQKKNPGARVSAVAWHPEFMKFAGRDLNKRFRAAFDTGMEDYAWAGWAAVKMVSDMVARRGPEAPGALLEHLKVDLAFDGQKGVDLSFRPSGQLRQPLLLVEDGRLVGEAPVRGVAASDADLDSLGATECRK